MNQDEENISIKDKLTLIKDDITKTQPTPGSKLFRVRLINKRNTFRAMN